jgi:hypothetical protein
MQGKYDKYIEHVYIKNINYVDHQHYFLLAMADLDFCEGQRMWPIGHKASISLH